MNNFTPLKRGIRGKGSGLLAQQAHYWPPNTRPTMADHARIWTLI